jgi:hypothetical protein
MLRFLLGLALALMLGGCRGQQGGAVVSTGYAPRDGDFVFQSLPHNALIDAIEGCSESPFSHCGMVVKRGEEWKVIEAIGPVKETRLAAWIAQGRGGAYAAYRLKAPLAGKVPAILAAAVKYEGRPYDLRYDMDDAKIYCSELLWKAVRDATGRKLGKIEKLGDLKWQPHEAVIRQLEGGTVPLEREMITPRAFSEAAELEEVFRYRM